MNKLKSISESNLFLTLAPIFLFFFCYLILNWSSIFTSCDEVGDLASNSLAVTRALNFEQLHGPYSRFNFFHPGPLLFYLYGVAEFFGSWFGISPYGSHNLGQIILNLLFISGSVYILSKNGSKIAAVLFFLAVLWALRPLGENILQFTWGPAATICPVIFFLVSGCSIYRGSGNPLPWHWAAASLAVQSHVGAAAVILPLELIILGGFIANRGFWKTNKNIFIFSILLLLILNLPILLDLFENGNRSNLFQLFKFFSNQHRGHDVIESVSLISPFFLNPLGLTNAALVPIFFALALLTTRRNHFLRVLFGLILAGYILSIFAGMRIVGRLHPHVIWYEAGIAATFWGALVVALASWLSNLFMTQHSGVNKIFASCVGLFLIVYCYFNFRFPISPLCTNEPTQLVSWINPKNDSVIKIHIERGGSWSLATGLALKLQRNGHSFCIDKSWQFIFGFNQVCTGNSSKHIRNLHFLSPKNAPDPEFPYQNISHGFIAEFPPAP